jgi:hypothetical protein
VVRETHSIEHIIHTTFPVTGHRQELEHVRKLEDQREPDYSTVIMVIKFETYLIPKNI